jgi:anaerobic magnesium-protoporphyrin IX monomethyl ester cyclase
MNVLLINPPLYRLIESRDVFFPSGLGYLASVLDEAGYLVRIYNADLPRNENYTQPSFTEHFQNHHKLYAALADDHHHVWREVSDTLQDFRPDAVGITSTTLTYPVARKIASLVKRYDRDCPVVIGGPHATTCAEAVLEDREFDYAVRGEGERTLLELVQYLEEHSPPLHTVAGLSFRQNGVVQHNPPRPLIQDLDAIPFPRRELSLDCALYRPAEICYVVTSRACPYRCTFCASHALWGNKVRFRSIPNVLEEIKYLASLYERPFISIADDTFGLDSTRVEQLCTCLLNEGANIAWACATRASLVQDEIIQHMRKAGCRFVYVGVESGSDRILRRIKKQITVEECKRAATILERNGVPWGSFFMVGFPDETLEDMQRTEELMKELRSLQTSLNIFTPLPGTELYEECQERGLIPAEPDWRLFDHYAPEVSVAAQVPEGQFEDIARRMFATADELNRRESSRWRRAWRLRGFYARHPLFLFERVLGFVKRRIHSQVLNQ